MLTELKLANVIAGILEIVVYPSSRKKKRYLENFHVVMLSIKAKLKMRFGKIIQESVVLKRSQDVRS